MSHRLINNKKNLQALLGFILLWVFSTVHATESYNKAWIPVTLNGNYGEFLYWVEPQVRLLEPQKIHAPAPVYYQPSHDTIFQEFLGSIAGGKKIFPEFTFWLGQAITTVSQDAVNNSREEYRAFEQIIWDHKSTLGFTINSRLRTEQRKSLEFPQWAFRIRERLILAFPLSQNMSFELHNEILYNLNAVPWITTTAWDQNRAAAMFVQKFSERYSFAAGYLNQYLFRDYPQDDHVLLLNFRFNLPE